jgi:tetratricopeptide (TPR) repeat protein
MKKLFLLFAFLGGLQSVFGQNAIELIAKVDSMMKLRQNIKVLPISDSCVLLCKIEFGETSFMYTRMLIRNITSRVNAKQADDNLDVRFAALKTQIERTVATEKEMIFLWMKYNAQLGSYTFDTGDYATTQIYYEKHLKLAREYYNSLDKEVLGAQQNFAMILLKQQKLEAGRKMLEETKIQVEKMEKPDSNVLGNIYINLGGAAGGTGNLSLAIQDFRLAVEIFHAIKNKNGELTALENLANIINYTGGDFAEIRGMYEQLLSGNREVYGENSMAITSTLKDYANFLMDASLQKQAQIIYEQIDNIFSKQKNDYSLSREYLDFLKAYRAFN